MQILLFGKVLKSDDVDFFKTLLNTLSKQQFKVYIQKPYQDILESHHINTDQLYVVHEDQLSKILKEIDMVFSIGGDGTILASAMLVKRTNVPILGFNTGRLGFLANIDKENSIDAIAKIKEKRYTIDKRSLIKLESEIGLFGDDTFALNDFTIQKKTSSSMITIHCNVNGEYFNSYWCNGIIVATPTGSTAFSMSCGGPIVLPYSQNIILTPIAPHNLNIRPVILPNDVSLSFEIESRNNEVFCTLDSRFEVIHPDTKLTIKPNDFRVHLVKLEGCDYFTTLRNKLMWGKDVRNK